MSYDALISALRGSSKSAVGTNAIEKYGMPDNREGTRRAKTSLVLSNQSLANKATGPAATCIGNGLLRGSEDDRALAPYLTLFRRAPLPHIGPRNEPRTATQWVVEQEHQHLAGLSGDVNKVSRCVPSEVLRLVTRDGPSDVPAARNDLKSAWLSGRGGLACDNSTGETSPSHITMRTKLHSGGVPRTSLTPISPTSSRPVRLKRRVSPDWLLSQRLPSVLCRYPRFAAVFDMLHPREQQAWKVYWGAVRNPHVRHCLERYVSIGMFSEEVHPQAYNELFQSGIFNSVPA